MLRAPDSITADLHTVSRFADHSDRFSILPSSGSGTTGFDIHPSIVQKMVQELHRVWGFTQVKETQAKETQGKVAQETV
jgi:hypothetical protein